tara:strand:+ start:265 stop:711 length:447 start_codon:yes stop_codon:yes gene_type:complete
MSSATPRLSSSSASSSSSRREKRIAEKEKSCNVQVVVRCRPPTKEETAHQVIECGQNTVNVGGRVAKHLRKSFLFDGVFGPDSTQNDVFASAVSPIVEEVLEGYNCTVFAYGMTGTGKTYTMEGGAFRKLERGEGRRVKEKRFSVLVR